MYTQAGFDLTTHSPASRDDTTRPSRPRLGVRFNFFQRNNFRVKFVLGEFDLAEIFLGPIRVLRICFAVVESADISIYVCMYWGRCCHNFLRFSAVIVLVTKKPFCKSEDVSTQASLGRLFCVYIHF
jgi:hypothetical protein